VYLRHLGQLALVALTVCSLLSSARGQTPYPVPTDTELFAAYCIGYLQGRYSATAGPHIICNTEHPELQPANRSRASYCAEATGETARAAVADADRISRLKRYLKAKRESTAPERDWRQFAPNGITTSWVNGGKDYDACVKPETEHDAFRRCSTACLVGGDGDECRTCVAQSSPEICRQRAARCSDLSRLPF
jgi:hypothetical protein